MKTRRSLNFLTIITFALFAALPLSSFAGNSGERGGGKNIRLSQGESIGCGNATGTRCIIVVCTSDAGCLASDLCTAGMSDDFDNYCEANN